LEDDIKVDMRTTVCVLDPAGLEESQKSGFHKNYKFSGIRDGM